jgi:hypothetical protein
LHNERAGIERFSPLLPKNAAITSLDGTRESGISSRCDGQLIDAAAVAASPFYPRRTALEKPEVHWMNCVIRPQLLTAPLTTTFSPATIATKNSSSSPNTLHLNTKGMGMTSNA